MVQNIVNNLDLLLINSPSFYNDKENIWESVNSNFPHLGIASIASYVRDKGFSVQIVDCNIESPSVDHFETYFKKQIAPVYSSIKHIGLTAFTFNINKAYKIAAICKKTYPDVKIIIGGTHASVLPEEVIRNDSVDIVVIGEGEITCYEIMSDRNLENIKGIMFKTIIDDEVCFIKTEPQERILDLDSLPQPAYDLLPIDRYRPAKGSYKRLPAMSMVTSRGCPGKCTFCVNALGKRLVFKSADTIYKEILYLIQNYGIKQLLFYDDTFTVKKDNVIRLCELIIHNNLDIAWTCFARTDFIDKDMLKTMKRAGCNQIMYGVENVNADVLRNINKRINKEQIINAVQWTKEIDIECRLAFMVGNPGDSIAIIKENIAFINTINPDYLVVNITTPFPGTEMFSWAKERNLILSYNWDDYTLSKPIMRLENLDENQIYDLYKLMYRSFYLRPKYIFQMIVSIRSLYDFKRLWDGFLAVFSFLK